MNTYAYFTLLSYHTSKQLCTIIFFYPLDHAKRYGIKKSSKNVNEQLYTTTSITISQVEREVVM